MYVMYVRRDAHLTRSHAVEQCMVQVPPWTRACPLSTGVDSYPPTLCISTTVHTDSPRADAQGRRHMDLNIVDVSRYRTVLPQTEIAPI